MSKLKVLIVSQEISPFVDSSNISDSSNSLAQSIQEKGHEVRCFMPRYGLINERRNQLHEVIRLSGMNIIINDNDHPLVIKVASLPGTRMQVYFIDNDEFFKRKAMLKDKNDEMFADNDERALFFARGVIETIKNLGWSPDIIHCNGWFTSLVPLYINKIYKDNPIFADTKVIYSAFEEGFESSLNNNLVEKIRYDKIEESSLKHIEDPTFTNITKLAVDHADGIIVDELTNNELVEYIGKLKQPVIKMKEQGENQEAINDFYEEVLEKSGVLAE
ncbi:MAG: glycogen/starch synthase [Bacteroidales bacterium]